MGAMTELPTTVIGLLAFLFTGSGFAIWRIQKSFLEYIQMKNGNLEKAIVIFTKAMEEQGERHKDAMVNQNNRHQQMMDDIAARLESLVGNTRNR